MKRISPLTGAGLLLGIGLGGFLDDITLHPDPAVGQYAVEPVPPDDLVAMKYNMIWDGVLHAMTWVVTIAGVVLLFRAGRSADNVWSGRVLGGSMLFGWGLFNFVEGVVDHHILDVHHVHPGQNQLTWDVGFLALGMVLMAIGVVLVRRRRARDGMRTYPPSPADALRGLKASRRGTRVP